ncbi:MULTISPECIES: hypothetical protein [Sphingomonas]|uniref:hypothetical protein n=1 Tax=Sphingomonas TaxID=13687 RepID=UPI000DEF975E|nr:MULTISPECIES: hypothetical protein [Sphingomonas]
MPASASRFITLALIAGALAACRQQPSPTNNVAATPAPVLSFAGTGRDRLCLAGNRAAFITYAAAGDHNCSVRGTLAGATLTADGDAQCQVTVTRTGDSIRLGPIAPNCAYYCAAPASFAGKTFTRTPKPEPVTDLAGDPLC